MINDFIVEAQKENNRLYVLLDGIYMKSEIDLALYLMKNEIRKLKPGFEVIIDIQNMDTGSSAMNLNFNKYRKLLRLMEPGTLRFKDLNHLFGEYEYQNGGYYPHENEWFF